MQIPLASHRYVIKIHIPEYKLSKITGRVLFFLLKVIALYFITTLIWWLKYYKYNNQIAVLGKQMLPHCKFIYQRRLKRNQLSHIILLHFNKS